MDEFLRVIALHRMGELETYSFDNEHTDKFLNHIKSLVSDKIYMDLEPEFTDAVTESTETAFLEGMKLAIAIMEKKYVPTI